MLSPLLPHPSRPNGIHIDLAGLGINRVIFSNPGQGSVFSLRWTTASLSSLMLELIGGRPGQSYQIEVSDDLNSWSPPQNLQYSESGPNALTINPENESEQFFRARSVP